MRRFALAALAVIPLGAEAQVASGVAAQVAYTSDYREQGVSVSDGHGALQGYVHYWRADGWYLGAFASQVDFDDPGTTVLEIDWYAGRNLPLGRATQLKLELMYHAYLGNETPGPTYDMLQAKVGASHNRGPLTLTGLASFVPEASYRSGQAVLLAGEATYQLRPGLSVSGELGRRWSIKNHQERTYWGIGGTVTRGRYQLQLRYVDTDLSPAECGFNPGVCGPAVVATLGYRLKP